MFQQAPQVENTYYNSYNLTENIQEREKNVKFSLWFYLNSQFFEIDITQLEITSLKICQHFKVYIVLAVSACIL